MNDIYIADKIIEGKNFSEKKLQIGEYDQCTFVNCSFSKGDISNCAFIECEFKNCDLSLALTENTSFQEVIFTDCKMIGIKFNLCNDFLISMKFMGCNLNLSSFYQFGDQVILFIPYHLAWGEQGGGGIPPQSDFIFQVEMFPSK